jgi:hypothetical protein
MSLVIPLTVLSKKKNKILWMLLDIMTFLQAKQYHIGVCKEPE